MLPGNGIGDTDKSCYPGSAEYKFKYGSEGLNTNDIQEYIRNPHKFNIKEEMDEVYYNLWSTDNDKTEANDDLVIKSVYDPSPVGYTMPASNAFTGFTTTGNGTNNPAELNVNGGFDKGWLLYCKPNKQGDTVFFPSCGWRRYETGSLEYVPTFGFYWVAGPYTRSTGRSLYVDSGGVFPLNYHRRSYGFTVRSAEERETHKFNIKPEMDGLYYNLWSTDNDKTEANDEVVIKSVYDPSPVGYSLPASNAFTGFTTRGGYTNNSSEFNVKGGFDKGWYFYTKPNKQGNIFWFPACGYRYSGTGSLGNVTTYGYCLAAGPNSRDDGRYLHFYSGDVNPLSSSDRGYGFPVRSAEERKLKYGLEVVARYWVLSLHSQSFSQQNNKHLQQAPFRR